MVYVFINVLSMSISSPAISSPCIFFIKEVPQCKSKWNLMVDMSHMFKKLIEFFFIFRIRDSNLDTVEN